MTTIRTRLLTGGILCVGLIMLAASAPNDGPLSPEAPEGANGFEAIPPPPTELYHEPVVEPPPEPPEERPSPIDFERVGAEMRGMAQRDDDEDRDLGRRRSGPNYFQVVASLLLVLGLILLLSHLLRRFGKGTPLLGGAGLGKVLGRIHLTPRSSLHFVRAADQVLVIGVSPNQISLVAQFEADAFEGLPEGGAEGRVSETQPPVTHFRDHLQNRTPRPESKPAAPAPDDEIDALRGEIQRLQAYLKEGRRGETDA